MQNPPFPPFPPVKRPQPVARVKEGAIELPIFRQVLRFKSRGKARAYASHFFSWSDGAGRHRERRATLEDAKARARQVARSLLNGQAAMANFDEAQRAQWLATCKNFARVGLDPVAGSAEYCSLLEKLRGIDPQATLAQLFDTWQAHRPRGLAAVPVPQLVKEFLAEKRDDLADNWYKSLAHCLRRFADAYGGFDAPRSDAPTLHALTSADLNTWLRNLKDKAGRPLGSRARHNHRAAVDQLSRWAKSNGRLPHAWLEMDQVKDPGTRAGPVKILPPGDLLKLLVARQNKEQLGRARKKSMIPFLACQAFAGIRHEELARPQNARARKLRLDWRDVHLDQRWIAISEQVSKTGSARSVPITDNLAAWLRPYAKASGPVCDLKNVSSALTRSKRAAKLPAGRNETKNTLRKSWTSYRLALVRNIGTVAEEAGNSPGIIRKHYRTVIPPWHVDGAAADGREWPLEPDARRWFDLKPEAADVLPLFAYARAKA